MAFVPSWLNPGRWSKLALCDYYSVVTRRLLLLICLAVATSKSAAQTPPPFEVHEATIAQIHDAMKAGRLTCKALVEQCMSDYDIDGWTGDTWT